MSLRSQLPGSEERKVPNSDTLHVGNFSGFLGVPRGISIKTNIFQYFHWISVVFNKIHGIPMDSNGNQWILCIFDGRPGRVGDQPEKGNRASCFFQAIAGARRAKLHSRTSCSGRLHAQKI